MLGAAALLALVGLAGAQEGSSPPPPAEASGASPAAPGVVDRVVAVVNDEVVLLSEVYEYRDYIEEAVRARGEAARLEAEKEVVERLIERILIKETVAQLGLGATDTQIDRAIDEIASRNQLDREQLRAEVEKSGLPWEVYRAELRAQVEENNFLMGVIRPRVNLSEDELRDAWRRMTAELPASAELQAIFLAGGDAAATEAARLQAESLRARALAGEDFASLARQYDQGSFGARDGAFGRFAPGELMAELDAAVQATPTGSVSTPVVTDRGVFLLRVVSRASVGPAFEEVRARLENQVASDRMEEEQRRWYQQARRQAAVKVLLGP